MKTEVGEWSVSIKKLSPKAILLNNRLIMFIKVSTIVSLLLLGYIIMFIVVLHGN